MAKTTYSVKDPNGFVQKRSTARTYVATVVIKKSLSKALAGGMQCDLYWARTWDMNVDYYTDIATGKIEGKYGTTQEQAKAMLAAGKDAWVAGKVDEARANLINSVTPILGADGDTYYINAGWAGRMDLAQKLAAKYESALIIPVA